MVSVPVLTSILTLLTSVFFCWHMTAELEIEAQVDTAGRKDQPGSQTVPFTLSLLLMCRPHDVPPPLTTHWIHGAWRLGLSASVHEKSPSDVGLPNGHRGRGSPAAAAAQPAALQMSL